MLHAYIELISLLDRLHRVVFSELEKRLCGFGVTDLTSAHAFVLMHIGGCPRSVDQLRNSTNYMGPTLTGLINKLATYDYVLRRRSPADKRIVNVSLTERGELLYRQLSDYAEGQSEFLHDVKIAVEVDDCSSKLLQLEDFLIDLILDGKDIAVYNAGAAAHSDVRGINLRFTSPDHEG